MTGKIVESDCYHILISVKSLKKILKKLRNTSIESLNKTSKEKPRNLWKNVNLDIYQNIVFCYGITQDPNAKDYMMGLYYCKNGNLRNFYLNKSYDHMKHYRLSKVANGLLSIHNAENVHKDFHSGMKKSDKKGVYGVLPYMAPEVLHRYQYTKAADIYSFRIIMNEYLSEEIPFNDIPYDFLENEGNGNCLSPSRCKFQSHKSNHPNSGWR
ncbi:hypothetical protein C1646_663002 [Rhizophagus diaphanus]|nr:hypothetical protein C1646_663002 [Rhizophagus diaphanus] [Rhizophagus sp. MUCL 43196]